MKRLLITLAILSPFAMVPRAGAGESEFIKLCESPGLSPGIVATLESMKKVAAGVFTGTAIDCPTAAARLTKMKALSLPGQTYAWLVTADLTPIATLDSLEELHIPDQKDTVDLAPLAGTHLKVLNIQNSGIGDLKGIEQIVSLESVFVTVESGTDLGPLARLPALKKITLDAKEAALKASATPYEIDVKTLAASRSLKELSLGTTPYISPQYVFRGLAYLDRLEKITIGSAFVDAADLRGIPLMGLTLSRGQLKNINTIAEIKTLRELTLDGLKIQKIDFLSTMTELRSLVLDENLIDDIDVLKNLKKLHALSLRRNQVTYARSLTDLTELRDLNLWGNQIMDLVVTNMTKLETLNAADNRMFTIRFHWRDRYEKLVDIDLSDNRLAVSGLNFKGENLPNLKNLDLSRNSISGVEKLAGITSLETLKIDENKIGDVSSLKTLVGLKYLSARGNVLREPLTCPVQPQTVCDFLHQD